MSSTAFQIDEPTGKKLDDMVRFFRVDTRADALKRCFALGLMAMDAADKDRRVIFKNPSEDREMHIALAE